MELTTNAAPAFSAAAGNNATVRQTALASDFNTFLQMLVVQAENQDPLNPIDSSEYAAQLASFASVEQQVLTNDLLEDLIGQASGSALAGLSGWVGSNVRVAAPVYFDGVPITVFPEVATGATSAELVVRDESGTIVGREALVPLATEMEWAGTDASGQPLPPGTYTFTVDSIKNGAIFQSRPAAAYAQVIEAHASAGGISLLLEGGASISVDEVLAVRLGQSGA